MYYCCHNYDRPLAASPRQRGAVPRGGDWWAHQGAADTGQAQQGVIFFVFYFIYIFFFQGLSFLVYLIFFF